MIEIKKYESSRSKEWDDFISNSRIDSFIFYRDFMDYHSHKFVDFSLMIYKKGNLDAVIPGNIDNDIFYSHQGLTYGGLITSINSKTVDVINYFNSITIFLKESGLKQVVYKSIPYIYNKLPSQEDVYALFRLNAEKIACNISSTIYQNNKLPFIELRKRGSKKAKKLLESMIYSLGKRKILKIYILLLFQKHILLLPFFPFHSFVFQFTFSKMFAKDVKGSEC